MSKQNWERVLALRGQNITMCDASVYWKADAARGDAVRCVVGVCNLLDYSYHVVDLDVQSVQSRVSDAGILANYSDHIILACELEAIKLSCELYPGSLIENDSQNAVVAAKTMSYATPVVWRHRSDIPLAHKVVTSAVGFGRFEFLQNFPGRGWLKFSEVKP